MKLSSNIVVTGGAGFIGSHLVDELISFGEKVLVIDDLSVGKKENLKLNDPQLTFLESDVVSDEALTLIASASMVYHLAVKNVRASLQKPIVNFQTNAMGTLQILDAMRNGSCGSFVYFSSSEVYGNTVAEKFSEQTVPMPTTVYAAGKLAGEHLTNAFHQSYGMDTRIIRPFNHYGSRAHFGGDSGELIPKFILRALANKDLIIHGDGLQTRDFCYSQDTSKWFIRVARESSLKGETINIGSGVETSVLEVANLVLRLTNSTSRIVHTEGRPADVRRLCASTRKIKSVFPEFSLGTKLENGIQQTIKYFESIDIIAALERETEFTWLDTES